MRELIVVTGLSGAGRSLAGDTLEDLGWHVIDNLPPSLLPALLEEADEPDSALDKVALVLGPGPDRSHIEPAIGLLRDASFPVRTVFLEARPRVLVQRYESVRRLHPFDDGHGLAAAIEAEAQALQAVRADADLVIDTSDFNVHEFRARLQDAFDSPSSGVKTRIMSFGYKHGLPLDVDLVFDCRFLPNPHWDEELRGFTGLEAPVAEFLSKQDRAVEFLERLDSMLDVLLPGYLDEGKGYVTLAFGCTGGRHRSVWMAEQVAERLRARSLDPSVAHRDVGE